MFASIWRGIKRMFHLPAGRNSASEILGPTLDALKKLGAQLISEAVNNAISTLSKDVTSVSNAVYTEVDKAFQGFGAPEWAVLINEAVGQVSQNASVSLTEYKTKLSDAITKKLGLTP